ncbi:MAG: hydrogenase 4 subunit B, partial [Actinomycetota bacterium]
MQSWLAIDWILLVLAAWLLIGLSGLPFLRNFAVVARLLFPLGAAAGLFLAALGAAALAEAPEVAILPIGLPQLPFHLRLDSLAAFFLMLLGGAAAGISIFAAGYFRHGEGTPPGLLCFEY